MDPEKTSIAESEKVSRADDLGLRIFALVTDAHGGFGGISQYNRDALEAMSIISPSGETHVLPRIAPAPLGSFPSNVRYDLSGLGSRPRYILAALRAAWRLRRTDVIYCAHLNLLPAAIAVAFVLRAPIVLAVYGVDAWTAPKLMRPSILRRWVSGVVSISVITRDRFHSWCPYPTDKVHIVPNAIRIEDYAENGADNPLVAKYCLEGKVVLLTFGRMAGEERAKGFDEMIDLMPRLIQDVPNIVYVAAGDGSDRERLQTKVDKLGLGERVIFTGRVADAEKSSLYGLADVYVMPSHGEGFGFVVLEALACGVPVVASEADGTREAVRDGVLGILVDPTSPDSIRAGILAGLKLSKRRLPGIEYFSFDNFVARLKASLLSVVKGEVTR